MLELLLLLLACPMPAFKFLLPELSARSGRYFSANSLDVPKSCEKDRGLLHADAADAIVECDRDNDELTHALLSIIKNAAWASWVPLTRDIAHTIETQYPTWIDFVPSHWKGRYSSVFSYCGTPPSDHANSLVESSDIVWWSCLSDNALCFAASNAEVFILDSRTGGWSNWDIILHDPDRLISNISDDMITSDMSLYHEQRRDGLHKMDAVFGNFLDHMFALRSPANMFESHEQHFPEPRGFQEGLFRADVLDSALWFAICFCVVFGFSFASSMTFGLHTSLQVRAFVAYVSVYLLAIVPTRAVEGMALANKGSSLRTNVAYVFAYLLAMFPTRAVKGEAPANKVSSLRTDVFAYLLAIFLTRAQKGEVPANKGSSPRTKVRPRLRVGADVLAQSRGRMRGSSMKLPLWQKRLVRACWVVLVVGTMHAGHAMRLADILGELGIKTAQITYKITIQKDSDCGCTGDSSSVKPASSKSKTASSTPTISKDIKFVDYVHLSYLWAWIRKEFKPQCPELDKKQINLKSEQTDRTLTGARPDDEDYFKRSGRQGNPGLAPHEIKLIMTCKPMLVLVSFDGPFSSRCGNCSHGFEEFPNGFMAIKEEPTVDAIVAEIKKKQPCTEVNTRTVELRDTYEKGPMNVMPSRVTTTLGPNDTFPRSRSTGINLACQ